MYLQEGLIKAKTVSVQKQNTTAKKAKTRVFSLILRAEKRPKKDILAK